LKLAIRKNINRKQVAKLTQKSGKAARRDENKEEGREKQQDKSRTKTIRRREEKSKSR
jgi:hypothetical protein